MGWNDHLENLSRVMECKECKQKFKVYETEQVPGFRDIEFLICPYCGKVLRESMEYEFITERLEK